MNADHGNEGIRIRGGNITAGALAVGRKARAENTTIGAPAVLMERGKSELAERLSELLRALEEHSNQVSNIDEVRGATESVAEELTKDKPNKLTVTGMLAGIAASVSSISEIATAASALREAAQQFL